MSKLVHQSSKGRVHAMDSITHVTPAEANDWVVTGSHGGMSSGEFALSCPLGLVVFNDAGVGRGGAGIASLEFLQARQVAAATVSNGSARIGDGLDTWECGIVSRTNAAAALLGLRVGDRLKEAIVRILA